MSDPFPFRGIMKTYARQPRRAVVTDENNPDMGFQFPQMRICMDVNGFVREERVECWPEKTADRIDFAAASSPSPPPSEQNAVFSSSNREHSSATPPSSPPPRLSPPPVSLHKPLFPNLKRKRPAIEDGASLAPEPLGEISDNKLRKAPVSKKARHLTQMQIDLGGEVRKTCKGCGMDFIPSNAEDAALHKQYHAMNRWGVDMGKIFLREVPILKALDEGETIVMLDAKSSPGLKRKAMRALEVVNQELGATEIDENILWGGFTAPVKRRGRPPKVKEGQAQPKDEKEDRFRLFLRLSSDKCIGLCLAERIQGAFKVMGADSTIKLGEEMAPEIKSSSISMKESSDSALLGISRIWTSKSHRRNGIASQLLDCARSNFFYGIEVPKDMVAFSQPTESGGELAKGWYGQAAGWHVYAGTQDSPAQAAHATES
ncbi:MAG: N-acetyltransferase O1 (Establishment of cohesion protein 1) [Icmadophila ericetorum]|nr:N-acetyltransferase O1 (Establishment of cohesion protein 1) [Icmadophila ericetorum]